MQCPSDDPVVVQKFKEMTDAAKRAHVSEVDIEKKTKEIGKDKLLRLVNGDLELTEDGFKEFSKLVVEQFKLLEKAKEAYQSYGMTCLNTLGLGRLIPVAKFQKKAVNEEKFKCTFCAKLFTDFNKLSEHMLRCHSEKFTAPIEKIWEKEKEKGNTSDKYNRYECSKCKTMFNSLTNRDAHEIRCSGESGKKICSGCNKVFSVNAIKTHRKNCSKPSE